MMRAIIFYDKEIIISNSSECPFKMGNVCAYKQYISMLEDYKDERPFCDFGIYCPLQKVKE